VLRGDLEAALKQAGFAGATCTKVRYVTRDSRDCLEAGFFEYATTRMPLETLEGYDRALSALPGVLSTRVVHDDAKNHREGTMGRLNPLRDQVIVTHLRMWNDGTKV
jgi:hypothetical protein